MTEETKAVAPRENNAARLNRLLKAYDRTPFTDWLTDLIEARASPEELKAWAKGSIDKHALVTKVVANLAGFSEVKVVEHRVNLEQMSDSELRVFIREQRKAIPLEVLEAHDEVAKEDDATQD